MSPDEATKQAAIARLISDLRAAKVELLSAQCATDRLRLQYSVSDIASFGDLRTLKGAIASAGAVCRFFASIQAQLDQSGRQE